VGIRVSKLVGLILCAAIAILTGCSSEGIPLDGNRSIFTTRGVLLHGTPPRPLSGVRIELVDLSGPKFSPFGPTGPQVFRQSGTVSDRRGRFTISIPNSILRGWRGQLLKVDICRRRAETRGMGRPIRVEFPGAIYAVTARGNERRKTFRDDADRRQFRGGI
jgi:hypothetical protein